MQLGIHLRELSRMRVGVLLSVLLAAFLSLSVGYKVAAVPP